MVERTDSSGSLKRAKVRVNGLEGEKDNQTGSGGGLGLNRKALWDYYIALYAIKRLSDTLNETLADLASRLGGDPEDAELYILRHPGEFTYYVPWESRWEVISAQRTDLASAVRTALLGLASDRINQSSELATLARATALALEGIPEGDVSDDDLAFLIRVLDGVNLGAGARGEPLWIRVPKPLAYLIAHLGDLKRGASIADPASGAGEILYAAYTLIRDGETLPRAEGSPARLPGGVTPPPAYIYAQEAEPAKALATWVSLQTAGIGGAVILGSAPGNPTLVGPTYPYSPRFASRVLTSLPPGAGWAWVWEAYRQYLAPEGLMAVFVPLDLLGAGAPDASIRQRLVDSGLIRGVVKVHHDLYQATGGLVILEASEQPERGLVMVDTYFAVEAAPEPPETLTPRVVRAFYLRRPIPGFATVVRPKTVASRGYSLDPAEYV